MYIGPSQQIYRSEHDAMQYNSQVFLIQIFHFSISHFYFVLQLI